LANRKEVLLSRGELVEIGGAFRIPDVMKRAGAILREVGTTNRTHLRDFKEHINLKVAALMKVHTSNYAIQGFTAEVSVQDLSQEAHAHSLPLIVDLGSGTLMDLNVLGLAHEPTVAEVIGQGADVVTFSGDKLLGGPQCGIIVGEKALIERMRKNPLRRALRLDKVMIAALEATLKLYLNPERVEQDLPTLRLFKRKASAIEAQAHRLQPLVQQALVGKAIVSVEPCASQIGSGALPVQTMPSFALVIKPLKPSKSKKPNKSGEPGANTMPLSNAMTHSEHGLEKLFRSLHTPVLGRVQKGQLVLDLRCLEERQESLFCEAISQLQLSVPT
jgi:L-seryl-tRNA(Ser) seleniumtransferase